MSSIPLSVRIVEVGPRDGLQNEAASVSTYTKTELITQLADAGLRNIEVGSFVAPRRVPRMADTAGVFAGLARREGVVYSALTPNLMGFEAAMAAGANEVAVFASASETFSQKNINCSIKESLKRFLPVLAAAKVNGIPVRAYVSCVAGCPYEGEIAPEAVASLATRLIELGCYEVSLGDTIGVGTPQAVWRLLDVVLAHIPARQVAVHFHDTYGQALANVLAALQRGISVVDCSVAGLGGCPYAPGASGNVATEDVVYMLNGLGVATGVDLDALVNAGRAICRALGKESGSRVARVHRAA